MELATIVDRFAEGLKAVDYSTQKETKNDRTGETYLPGVKTLREKSFVEELMNWWIEAYPTDFDPKGGIKVEVDYVGLPRAKCDLILSSDGSDLVQPEWSIEVKHIALVGNNGKNNDYGPQKILSPYLKDRSLIHDIERLRKHGMGKKRAVIGYSFAYNFITCADAEVKHPNHLGYVRNIRQVCKSNDPVNGELSVLPMIEFADEIFLHNGLVKPVITREFHDAWRHPCGGYGHIFGWEIVTSDDLREATSFSAT